MREFLLQMGPVMTLGLMFGLIPYWFIFKKAGRSPWWALFTVAPFGIFVLPWIVAFMPWRTRPTPKAMGDVFD